MKLNLLLSEATCQHCEKRLDADDLVQIKSGFPKLCSSCSARKKKKDKREQDESYNMRDRNNAHNMNLIHVSQQIPDRGHDQNRGTAGWIMGEPSPGRSF